MINEPCYEARIAIPALQSKIFQFIREELPALEDSVIKEVIRNAFAEPALKDYVSRIVRAAFEDEIHQTARKLLRSEFADELTDTIRHQIMQELQIDE